MSTAKPAFAVRGLEVHSSRMWQAGPMRTTLELMSATGLNTLLLHQNDLIDVLLFMPPGYLASRVLYERYPVQRSRAVAKRLFLQRLVQDAASLGIEVYLEVKEISVPDPLLELRPELRGPGGRLCPTDPFWAQLLEDKCRAVLDFLPGLGGVVVSLGTRESQLSIAANPCDCARCAATDPSSWYEGMIRAMHRPIQDRGRTLAVRDFTYSIQQQGELVAAVGAVSPDIALAMKNVPHDFWPTFPDNPRISETVGSRRWVEFDVFGQYCGLGVFPCGLLEDLRARLQHCSRYGVEGAWFRTDWELIEDTSAFNGLSKLNLYAGAAWSTDLDEPAEDIARLWLQGGILTALRPESERRVPAVPTAPDAAERLLRWMLAGWRVLEKTLYSRGHVFQYSSKISPSLADLFYVVRAYHRRDQWDPGSAERVSATDANIAAVVAEKEAARREATALSSMLDVATLGVPAWLAEELELVHELLAEYVELFSTSVTAAFLVERALGTGGRQHVAAARAACEDLRAFGVHLAQRLRGTTYPHYLYWLFDAPLVDELSTDLERRMEVRG